MYVMTEQESEGGGEGEKLCTVFLPTLFFLSPAAIVCAQSNNTNKRALVYVYEYMCVGVCSLRVSLWGEGGRKPSLFKFVNVCFSDTELVFVSRESLTTMRNWEELQPFLEVVLFCAARMKIKPHLLTLTRSSC